MASTSKHNAGAPTDREAARLMSLMTDIEPASAPIATELLFLSLASSSPLPTPEELERASAAKTAPPQAFWLDGDALMCACPDCGAPMTVRLWLMIADCWRCGASIELSQEQEREAMRLLAEREQALRRPAQPAAEAKLKPSANPATPVRPQTPTSPAPRDKHSPRPQPGAALAARDRTAPAPPPGERRRVAAPTPAAAPVELSVIGTTGVWLRDAFRDMPAWLISLIVHLVALTLLGLMTYGEEEDRTIILSTIISQWDRNAGESVKVDPLNEVIFNLPLPDKIDMRDEKTREVMMKAAQDARELQINPDAIDPQLPALDKVKDAIGRGGAARTPLVARDPRVRAEMIKAEGGTTLTEAAVARGLRWLSMNQHKDGSWKLHSLPHANGGEGGVHSDAAGTSLALLPFLGAGQTHLVGIYKDNVSLGLRWLVQQQKEDGDLRDNEKDSMYAHGQCAIVLCEAYAMTRDEAFKEPAQKALDFIAKAQHAGGGWRYKPGEAGDTSVVGWQLMALQSGRAAGLEVKEEVLENAGHYLDSVALNDNSRYAYMRGQGPTHVMTAEALLCRIYLGWRKDEPGLGKGVEWLLQEHPPDRRAPDMYYWYYATQTVHHYGGREWNQWNQQMRAVLVSMQEQSGKNAGSWSPAGPHASAGGRIYMTSLAVCSLEVYYRHLPVFKQLELEVEEEKDR